MSDSLNTDYSKIIDALIAEKRSELSNLFSPNALSSLGSNLETLLEEHPNDSIVKILWSLAQTESDELPLPFIASSLLELVQNQNILNEHPRLCFLVAQLVSQSLIKAGELRSAIFLLADFILNPLSGFYLDSAEWKEARKALLETIENEKNLALKKREPTSYINSLSDLSGKLNKAKTPSIKATTTRSSEINATLIHPKPSPVANTEFILGENSNLEDKSNILKPDKNFQYVTTPKTKIPKIAFLIGIMLIAGIALGMNLNKITLVVYDLKQLFSKNSENQLAYETRINDLGRPIYPNIKPFSLTDLSPSLEDINKRLERISSTRETKPQITNEATPTSTPQVDQSEIESLNNIPDKSPSPQTPVPKLPNLPENMGTAIDLGTNSKVTTTSGQRATGTSTDPGTIKKGPDGRAYGPPQVIDPTLGKQNERALDGSPLKSYEVERFDPPLVFETITATNVLAAPSLMSASITRLKSATPIHVTATMGFWLELRSNEGKVGYIFAQDAIRK